MLETANGNDHASHATRILVTSIAVIIPAMLVFALYRHVSAEINWLEPFQTSTNVGTHCQAATGPWLPSTNPRTILEQPHSFEPAPMPYRGTAYNPSIHENEYLFVECPVDLTNLQSGSFAWLQLGTLMGETAVFVDSDLIYKSSENGQLGFPVPPEKFGKPVRLRIISRGTAEGRPGPASLIPMILVQSRAELAKVQYTLNSWTTDLPIFRFGISLSVGLMLAILWLLGLRYQDLGVMIVLAFAVAANSYLDFRLPGIPISPFRAVFFAMLQLCKVVFIACFVLRFCRVKIDWQPEVWGTALVAAYGLAVWLVPEEVFFQWRLFAQIPSYFGSALILAASIVGVRFIRKVESINGLRLIRMTVVCGIGFLSSMCFFFQSAAEDRWGIAVDPYLSLMILLIFSGIMIHDLVIHQRGFFLEKLERQRAEAAAKADRSIAQIMQMIAHDIRRPLTLLKGFANPDASSDSRMIVEEIRRSITNVEGMVSDITDASSVAQPLLEPVDLLPLITSVVHDSVAYTGKQPGSLRIEIPSTIVIHGDIRKLRRVFSNLVQNALEAMPADAELWIKAHHDSDGRTVTTEVGNSGSFIPHLIRPQLFERFFSHKKSGGTGLGLAAVRQMVQLHGGNVWFESTEETGTQFFVTLMAVNESDQGKTNLDSEHIESTEKVSWVLAEDSLYVAQRWLEAFSGENIQHYFAPEDLIADWPRLVHQRSRPPILITDYYFTHTSTLTGLDLICELKRLTPSLIAILASDAEIDEPLDPAIVARISKETLPPKSVLALIQKRPLHQGRSRAT